MDSFEQRLQRLEEARVETTGHLSEQTATLAALSDNFKDMCVDLKSHNAKMVKFLDKLEDKLVDHVSRLEALERQDKERARMNHWTRKLIFTLVVGGAGSIGTLIINKLFGA